MQYNNNKFTVTVLLFISTLGTNTTNAQTIINNYKKLHIAALIAMGATDIKRIEFIIHWMAKWFGPAMDISAAWRRQGRSTPVFGASSG